MNFDSVSDLIKKNSWTGWLIDYSVTILRVKNIRVGALLLSLHPLVLNF